MTPGDPADAVRSANAAFYDAFEAADIDLMNAIWLDGPRADDVVCVHPGSPPLRGRDAVLRSWSMVMANTPYIQFVLTDVAVTLEGDIAVVSCAENILTGMPESTESLPAAAAGLAGGRIVATNIFKLTSVGWRLWVHHASPVVSAVDDEREEGGT